MENKVIKLGDSTQAKVIAGVDKIVDAIKLSMGPAGRGIAIEDDGFGVQITRDGATIAKSVKLSDPEENIGAELVKKAASMTEDKAGDATSSTSLLIRELCKKGQKAVSVGANVNELKAGMLKAGKWMTELCRLSRR